MRINSHLYFPVIFVFFMVGYAPPDLTDIPPLHSSNTNISRDASTRYYQVFHICRGTGQQNCQSVDGQFRLADDLSHRFSSSRTMAAVARVIAAGSSYWKMDRPIERPAAPAYIVPRIICRVSLSEPFEPPAITAGSEVESTTRSNSSGPIVVDPSDTSQFTRIHAVGTHFIVECSGGWPALTPELR